MPHTRGIAIRAGFRREAAVTSPLWPAVSAAAITTLLPLRNTQSNDGVEKAGSITTAAAFGPEDFDVIHKAPSDVTPLTVHYQGLEPLWACALGQAPVIIGATTFPELLSAGVYRQLFEVAPHLSTATRWEADQGQPANSRKVRRGTLAIDYQVSVWEYLSAMAQAVTWQFENGYLTATVEWVAHSLEHEYTVNTSVDLEGAAWPTTPRAKFSDLVMRLDHFSGSTPLGAADVLDRVSTWSLRLDNNLVTSYGPRTGLSPEEYERADPARVTLTFVDARHTSDQWQARWANNDAFMVDVKLTSETNIPGTSTPYALRFYLPRCKVTNAQLNTGGSRLPPDTAQLVATMPTVAAAGFPVTSRLCPFFMESVSGDSSHSLVG